MIQEILRKTSPPPRTLHGRPSTPTPHSAGPGTGPWNSPRAGLRFGASKESSGFSRLKLRREFAETSSSPGGECDAEAGEGRPQPRSGRNAHEDRRLVRGDRGHRRRGGADGRERDAVVRARRADRRSICRPSRPRSSTGASAACRSSTDRASATSRSRARGRRGARACAPARRPPGRPVAPAAADRADAAAPGPGGGVVRGHVPRPRLRRPGAPAGRPTRTATSGPTYFIQAVNTSIGIFSKTDGARVAAFTFDALFPGTGTLCDNDNGGDPTVTYDPVGDRWFVADFAFSGERERSAVLRVHRGLEDAATPSRGGWYFYAVRADDAAHPWFPDYPKMGIWPDGLYMTANMFRQHVPGGARLGVQPRRHGRAARRCGPPSSTRTPRRTSACCRATCARSPARRRRAGRTSSSPSRRRPTGCRSSSSTSTSRAAARPSPGRRTSATRATRSPAATAPSPGTRWTRCAERLMNSAQYTNIDGVESLWVNHTDPLLRDDERSGRDPVDPGQRHRRQRRHDAGPAAGLPGHERRAAPLDGQPRRRQEGRHGARLQRLELDAESRHPLRGPVRGRSRSGPCRRPRRRCFRASRAARSSELRRLTAAWGDYSAMTLDPNGCDFWFTTEYYATTGSNWQTRIGSFRLNPSCTPSAAAAADAADDHVRSAPGQDVRRRRLHGQRHGVVGPAGVLHRGRTTARSRATPSI